MNKQPRGRTALLSIALLAIFLASSPSSVGAQTGDGFAYAEAESGDITGDPVNPLPLQASAGSNTLSGQIEAGDLDYVTVNVPADHELAAINLTEYVSGNSQSFIAVQNGTEFTEPPTETNVDNLLGFTLFGDASLGTDILPVIGTNAQGFTAPLPAGDYTFWIQETNPIGAEFTFDFVVESTVVVEEAICNGETVTVNLANGDQPTGGDDVILGTDGADVINGLGGNDTICGGAGADRIIGGAGADSIIGGRGNDVLIGGRGNDELIGGRGNDELSGARGNDTLRGNAGDDVLNGGNGNDTIFGGRNADEIQGNAGADDLRGGNGADTIYYDADDTNFDGGGQNQDTLLNV